MERAVFGTLFSCGFKKKSEASEEEVAESQQSRAEREAREAKELSDKARSKRTALRRSTCCDATDIARYSFYDRFPLL